MDIRKWLKNVESGPDVLVLRYHQTRNSMLGAGNEMKCTYSEESMWKNNILIYIYVWCWGLIHWGTVIPGTREAMRCSGRYLTHRGSLGEGIKDFTERHLVSQLSPPPLVASSISSLFCPTSPSGLCSSWEGPKRSAVSQVCRRATVAFWVTSKRKSPPLGPVCCPVNYRQRYVLLKKRTTTPCPTSDTLTAEIQLCILKPHCRLYFYFVLFSNFLAFIALKRIKYTPHLGGLHYNYMERNNLATTFWSPILKE